MFGRNPTISSLKERMVAPSAFRTIFAKVLSVWKVLWYKDWMKVSFLDGSWLDGESV